jgi:hypothetical protein
MDGVGYSVGCYLAVYFLRESPFGFDLRRDLGRVYRGRLVEDFGAE